MILALKYYVFKKIRNGWGLLYSCAIPPFGVRTTIHKPLVTHASGTYMPVFHYLDIYEHCISIMVQLSCVIFRCYATLWASFVVVLLDISWLILAIEVRNNIVSFRGKDNRDLPHCRICSRRL